jgi:Ricin-type beta-trefoil lectin domain-like
MHFTPRNLCNRLGGFAAAAILLAGAGLAATTTGAKAQSASATSITPFAGVFNPIKNVGNGMCLQPANGSTADAAAIVQEPCVRGGSPAQSWEDRQVGTNHYRFINQASGLCFDAFDGALNGGRLLQGECKSISNEEFNTGKELPDVVSLESRVGFRNTGFCIDVPGAQATAGLAVQIFRCNGTLAQRWVVGFPG